MVPVQLAGTLGREVCLFRSMQTMTAAELWSKAGKKIEEDCNLQIGTKQTQRNSSILQNKLI